MIGPLILAAFLPRTAAARAESTFDAGVSKIEAKTEGRIGVFAMRGRQTWAHRANERFAYCSTFKWILAADVLRFVDEGKLRLERTVAYSKSDLVGYSPVTAKHVGEGRLSVEALSAAAVEKSDNAAANLLEPLVGGPAGLQSFVRSWGDKVMRFDRLEPAMSDNDPGDNRDTTSPKSMTQLLKTALETNRLSKVSRDRLLSWMKAADTGLKRIRAGAPQGWTVADKTGTCGHGGANDVAVIYPPQSDPVYLTVFTDGDRASHEKKETAIAEVASLLLNSLR